MNFIKRIQRCSIIHNFVCYLFFFSFPVITFSSTVINNNYQTQKVSLKQLVGNNPILLNGYKPISSVYFPVNKSSDVKKFTLHLYMTASALLNVNSSVEIQLDQITLRRIKLEEIRNQKQWDIELPLSNFSAGWHSLSFSATLSSEKNLCDPEIWVSIADSSSLSLTYQELPFKSSLNELPYPFIDPLNVNNSPVVLVLAENFDDLELYSLFKTAFELGKMAVKSKIKLTTTILKNSITDFVNNHLILIGTWKHLLADKDTSNFLQPIPDVLKKLNDKAGVIWLKASIYNPNYAQLILSGKNYTAVDKAVSALIFPEFKTLAAGNVALIDVMREDISNRTNLNSAKFTLEQLGYSDANVTGLGSHHLIYNIPLPTNRIPDSAYILTSITAPKIPGNHHSRITLVVNGVKQSTTWIKEEHSIWKAPIKPGILRPGTNEIDYVIDLHLEKEQCLAENFDEVWATLYAQTQIQISFNEGLPKAMINQLLAPFGPTLNVILPKNIPKTNIDQYTQLFLKLGQLSQTFSSQIIFRNSETVNEEFVRNENIVLIGTPDNNPWIKFALDYMPVQFHSFSRTFSSNEKKLQMSIESALGLIELLPSPWSANHAVLLISGKNDQALLKAINTLENDQKRSSLNANIALINAEDSITLLNSYENFSLNTNQGLKRKIINLFKNLYFQIKYYPQLLIYLFAIILPLLILFKRRNK